MIKAVLTGDIVDSSTIRGTDRDSLLSLIRATAEEISALYPLEIELFRGDSFQILTECASSAAKIGVLFRAALRAKTPETSCNIWDARISVGIGHTDYNNTDIRISDGEAYRLSGRGLDEIGRHRLVIATEWEDINEELAVSTSFADDVITSWSRIQAEISYIRILSGESQKDIASKTGKTAQNISKILSASKESLISRYLNRCTEILDHKIKTL